MYERSFEGAKMKHNNSKNIYKYIYYIQNIITFAAKLYFAIIQILISENYEAVSSTTKYRE
jgi:hypothetical protein